MSSGWLLWILNERWKFEYNNLSQIETRIIELTEMNGNESKFLYYVWNRFYTLDSLKQRVILFAMHIHCNAYLSWSEMKNQQW